MKTKRAVLVLFLFTIVAVASCKSRSDLTSDEKVLNGESAPDWETDVYQIPGGTGLLVPDIDGGSKSRLIATARHVVKKGPIKSKSDGRILEVEETFNAPAKDNGINPDLKIVVLKDCVNTKKKITLRHLDNDLLIGRLARGYGYGSDTTGANEIPRLSDHLNQGQLRIRRLEKIEKPYENYSSFFTAAEGAQTPAWCPGDSGGPVMIHTETQNLWVGTIVAYHYVSYINTVCVADAGSTRSPVTPFILTSAFFDGLASAMGLADSAAIIAKFNTPYSSAEQSCELLNPISDIDNLSEKLIVSILRNLPFYFEDVELDEKNATVESRADYKLWPERKKKAFLYVKSYFAKFREELSGRNWKLPEKGDLESVTKHLKRLYAPQAISEQNLIWLKLENSASSSEKYFSIYLPATETVRTTSNLDPNTQLSACFRSHGNAVIPISDYLNWLNGLREKYSCKQ